MSQKSKDEFLGRKGSSRSDVGAQELVHHQLAWIVLRLAEDGKERLWEVFFNHSPSKFDLQGVGAADQVEATDGFFFAVKFLPPQSVASMASERNRKSRIGTKRISSSK